MGPSSSTSPDWSRLVVSPSQAPVGEEEPQHLAARIRPARVGVGSCLAPARPGMTGSMENPLLEDGTLTLALLNRTGVGGPTLGLPAAHGCAQIRPCPRLGNDLVAVDRAHSGVAVPVKHDRGHRAPRAVERYACRR